MSQERNSEVQIQIDTMNDNEKGIGELGEILMPIMSNSPLAENMLSEEPNKGPESSLDQSLYVSNGKLSDIIIIIHRFLKDCWL